MLTALITSWCLCAAPVPNHLIPPQPDPIRVGAEWWYHDHRGAAYLLKITRVEGDRVFYRCVNWPDKSFGCVVGVPDGWSVQSVKTTLHEMATQPARCQSLYPEPGLPDWVYRR